MITLEPVDKLIPASYNPRKVIKERLDMVKLSLQKLGWLSPVFATPTGEILSGHQRTFCARELGYTVVPVFVVPHVEENKRKALNMLFNRSTNDMDLDSNPDKLSVELLNQNVLNIAAGLPDHPIDIFPCIQWAKERPIADLVKLNSGRWIRYALNVSKTLWKNGIIMPIIVGPDGLVVNGIGRLQLLAEKKKQSGVFVEIPAERVAFAAAMLNLLSMNFDVRDKYADLLRYNSFRRARKVRKELGRGFTFALIGNKPAKSFDIGNPDKRKQWMALHGRTILDFGAGHLHETRLLRENGFDVTPFEPYRLGQDGEINKSEALTLAREFLSQVAAGKQWSSIFISSVLNSVPFEADRYHIVKILANLCSKHTRCYAAALNEKTTEFTNFTTRSLNKQRARLSKVELDYEPNITVGEIGDKPKVQKYHTTDMFYSLFKSSFERVRVANVGDNVTAICEGNKGHQGLRQALEFEFDLPYPDGSRMGLASEAIAAFSKRLNVAL